MAEIIVKYKEDTDRMKVKGGEYVQDLIRCKDCKWRDHSGCALLIVDDSDKPKDNDFCSFGERKEDAADRPQGEWMEDEEGYWRCTNCGRKAEWEFFEDNYCPRCGARMK